MTSLVGLSTSGLRLEGFLFQGDTIGSDDYSRHDEQFTLPITIRPSTESGARMLEIVVLLFVTCMVVFILLHYSALASNIN